MCRHHILYIPVAGSACPTLYIHPWIVCQYRGCKRSHKLPSLKKFIKIIFCPFPVAMSDIDNDINMALWRAAMCGDSEAVSHALDGNKLLRCVDERQYKSKMSIGSQIRIAGMDGFHYEVDDLPVTIYGELDYSRNYVYPNSSGKIALAITKNPKG